MRRPLVATAVAAALGVVATPATTLAAGGGTAAPLPGSGSSGPPVATAFELPGPAGRSPTHLRLRVDDPGVRTMRVRVSLTSSDAPGKRLSFDFGVQRTGRLLELEWPGSPAPGPGRYAVRLHVVDALGRRLDRASGSPSRRSLTVDPSPVPNASDASAPSLDAAFPVAGPHTYGEAFGAPRRGYRHQGQDIAAASGVPVVAPVAGTVTATGFQARAAGEWIVERAATGEELFFAHCRAQSTAVVIGQAVSAGTLLCRVGATGDATGPHLHFEIWLGGWRSKDGRPTDPLPFLRRWEIGRRR